MIVATGSAAPRLAPPAEGHGAAGAGVPGRDDELPDAMAAAGSAHAARASVAHDEEGGRLPALVVFAAVLAVSLLAITPHPLGVFADDGMYAVLAKSLAEGTGYRFINLPGAPAGTHFPPVYPAMLALLWKLFPAFPANVLVFKAANALLNALAAVLAFRLGHRVLGLPRAAAAGAAVLAGVAVPSLLLAGMVLSEPLFLVLLLAALPFAERVRRAPTTRDALLLGLAGGALMLTRSLGVAFILACIAALLLVRRWRHALLVGAAAAALVVPWQAWVAAHDAELPPVLRGKYGSYTGWLSRGVATHGTSFVLRTVTDNVDQGARMTVEPLRPPRAPWTYPLALAAGVVVLAAAGARLARRAPVTLLFIGGYVGIVMLWPFAPGRFLWGLWPLVLLLVAAAAAELWPWLRRTDAGGRPWDEHDWRPVARRAVAAVGIASVAALTLGGIAHAAWGYHKGWHASIALRREATAGAVLQWVLANTSPADVVASDEEAMVYLYTGRLGTPATRFTPDEYLVTPTPQERARDLEEIVRHYRPDWVVSTAPISVTGALELVGRAPGLVRVVDSLPPNGVVLRPINAND